MSRRSVLLALLYLAISVAFCAPLFAMPNGLGVQDWDAHSFYYGSVLKSVVEYGQLPFWNPWYCGGNVLWQNPQVSLFSLVYPLAAVVSLPLAVKINIVFHYWIGFVGMHLLLSRAIGLSFLPVIVFLGAVFTLAGAPVLHLAVGHNNFLPAFYLPLQLFWFVRAIQRGMVRDALLAGMLLALMVYEGGAHIMPMAIAGLGACGVVAAIGAREWRPLLLLVALVASGCAFAAPKLLPIALLTRSVSFFDARTVTGHPDLMTREMLARTYLDGDQDRSLRFDQQRHGWYEYGNYIGTLAALAIVASIIWIFTARQLPAREIGAALALGTMLLFAMSAGEFSSWAPASLAAHVPLFSSFRIPSRYTFVAVLLGAATAGWALHAIGVETALGPRARLFVATVCLLGTMDLFVRNSAQLEGSFRYEPFDMRFHVLDGPRTLDTDYNSDPYRSGSPMFRALMHDRSFYQCYEGLQLTHTADATHPLVFSDGDTKIFATTFTPNRVEFTVAVGYESAKVFLNQNWTEGWRSTAGEVTNKGSGKPTVTLAPGQAGKVAFIFAPPGLAIGVVLFFLAVAGSALGWRRRIGS